MAHHHKSNREVGSDPLRGGEGRGLPRRPDEAELERRTLRDRREAGLPARAPEESDTVYREARAEVERQVGTGEMTTAATRGERDPFPPTRYRR
ncbi:hypothetical protein [Streptomyces sp. t39]|uniref:hypothetical protein n=1 Tax=Streptomyces sp. t39 TaxID=1828156 RepID=UPI0011CE38C7|nr:hypothetical protein [Streptomyces sp. t39]TXS52308.1 hypothetical protein EAO77_21225 [Streptomyces sp. t39]